MLKYTGVFGGVQGLKTIVSLLKNKLMSSILHSTGVLRLARTKILIKFLLSRA